MLYYTKYLYYFIIKLGEIMNQDKLNNIIGKNIKKYRLAYKNEKITQEKLAELINVSVSLISNVESNKSKKGISITNLYKISVVLNIPISKFMEEDNELQWIFIKTIY